MRPLNPNRHTDILIHFLKILSCDIVLLPLPLAAIYSGIVHTEPITILRRLALCNSFRGIQDNNPHDCRISNNILDQKIFTAKLKTVTHWCLRKVLLMSFIDTTLVVDLPMWHAVWISCMTLQQCTKAVSCASGQPVGQTQKHHANFFATKTKNI